MLSLSLSLSTSSCSKSDLSLLCFCFDLLQNCASLLQSKSKSHKETTETEILEVLPERVAPPFGESENCTLGHLQICCLSIIRAPVFYSVIPPFYFLLSALISTSSCPLSLFLSPFHLIFPLLHGTVLL